MAQQRSFLNYVFLSTEHTPSPLVGEGWGEGAVKP